MSAEPGLAGRGSAYQPHLERALYEACLRVRRVSHATSDRQIRRLVLYPPFPNRAALADILNRVSWGLSLHPPEKVSIDAPCLFAEEMTRDGPGGLSAPASHENYLLRESFLGRCRWLDAKSARDSMTEADLLLVWDARALRQPAVLARADKTVIVDPSYFRDVEALNVATLLSRLLGWKARQESRAQSARRYETLLRRFEGVEDAYIFFTGPSLEAGLTRPLIENSARLICNSLVRNRGLVEKIRPDAVMFLDPAYHMGISRYAAEFRAGVARVLADFPSCVCIVPEGFAPLVQRELPGGTGDRIIGVPVLRPRRYNIPTSTSFYVKQTGNILTQLMLPVASSLVSRVHILGADGRQNGDSGFWRHMPAAQFGDLLGTIDSAHPSLSRDTNHERYYREHCRVTAQLLKEGEQRCGKAYVSETPSFIPALAARFRAGEPA